MNPVTALVAGLAALTVISTAAEAAQGCGKGWHYNGQRCVQVGTDSRQPYPRHKGSSADLGDQNGPSHRRRVSSEDLGDHYRSSYGRRVYSSASLRDEYRPSHRHKGISVDLGPMRLHLHHGED
jgi:hypothetical protein